MPDRHGTTLQPGDPVIYQHDPDTTSTATVLSECSDNRYRIQLDQRDPSVPKLPALVALADQMEASGLDTDTQEPFEVDGSTLTFMGDWDEYADDDDDDDDDEL